MRKERNWREYDPTSWQPEDGRVNANIALDRWQTFRRLGMPEFADDPNELDFSERELAKTLRVIAKCGYPLAYSGEEAEFALALQVIANALDNPKAPIRLVLAKSEGAGAGRPVFDGERTVREWRDREIAAFLWDALKQTAGRKKPAMHDTREQFGVSNETIYTALRRIAPVLSWERLGWMDVPEAERRKFEDAET
jgi:hypothetical protein